MAQEDTKNDRLAVVSQLVNFSAPLAVLSEGLTKFEWDFKGTPCILQVSQLKNVINRYLQGKLTEEEIEKWANLVEGREDVEFEKGYENKIKDVIHELANPLLTEELTKKRASVLLENLNHSTT